VTAPSASYTVPGLSGDAEIIVDRWGIPHIYAASTEDAFLVQGFNAARDRLWQIDLWRRRGLGRLSEAFGPAYVAQDRAARLLLYRGDMAAEWRAYGAKAKAWTEAFAGGINAFVAWVGQDRSRLPIEFRLLGHTPAMWSAEDIVRIRSHGRVRNVENETLRTEMAVRFGIESDAVRKSLEPAWTLRWPEGLAKEAIPSEVMSVYRLGTEPVAFGNDKLPERVDSSTIGSNNWALAPSRTTTGRPILASDPHRVHEQPSLRYISHLSAPGFEVIGAAEPNVPGVSLGHNRDIAFGLTIFPIDQEDLYVYELHPADPNRYRYGTVWEPMRIVRETVTVRGGGDTEVELPFTRHGPVLHVDRGRNRAYALRTVWAEPGTAPYFASLAYLEARNWKEFTATLGGWGSPSVNHVYADVAGNVGWITAGLAPIRPNWDGLMPVPGDGRYEWAGFMPAEKHPRIYNPSKSWVATANQMNLPDGYPYGERKLSFEWADKSRYQRIAEGLEALPRHSIDDTKTLQTDFTTLAGRRLTRLLPGLSTNSPETRQAIDLLTRWNHKLDAVSAGGALFEIWFMRHLTPAVIANLAPGAEAVIQTPDTAAIVDMLERPDQKLAGRRDGLLLDTLAKAWAEAVALMGADSRFWTWGQLHHGYFQHPLSSVVGESLKRKLDVGPRPKGGSGITVNNNGYRQPDFRVISGVSFRMIVDVGHWDGSFAINTPGQSGDPESPHYRDLFDRWSKEDYVPLLFSRKAVEEAAEMRIVLHRSDQANAPQRRRTEVDI
jgi:penicillin amidase